MRKKTFRNLIVCAGLAAASAIMPLAASAQAPVPDSSETAERAAAFGNASDRGDRLCRRPQLVMFPNSRGRS